MRGKFVLYSHQAQRLRWRPQPCLASHLAETSCQTLLWKAIANACAMWLNLCIKPALRLGRTHNAAFTVPQEGGKARELVHSTPRVSLTSLLDHRKDASQSQELFKVFIIDPVLRLLGRYRHTMELHQRSCY